MSRHLPAQPNLEHLKKQAKDLLPDLQRQQPDAKLADALHAIAREYGFTTWPQLKAHVESLPRPAAPGFGNPFAGTWIAEVSKSKRHPANQFESATIQFAVDGHAVTITHAYVDASGREERGTNTIHADGQERQSESGYVFMARWRGAHVLETVATKDGQVVGRGTYEVSDDGATLTIASGETAGFSADSADQLIVLNRSIS